MSGENIFSTLAKYNSANDENYLTEAFVFLLNSLLERERASGLEILTKLCVKHNDFSFDMDEVISVSAQETTEQGTPDIRVFSPNKLSYIEVKDYATVNPDALKRYKEALKSSKAAFTSLVLLTRFPVDFSEHKGIPDKFIRWFEVYNWLAVAKRQVEDPVSEYLIDEFSSFLEVKQMSIQKIGWEYIEGIPAMNNLVNMIDVAIQTLPISKYWKSARWQHRGFYIEDNKLWCGIHYNNPLVITFEMDRKKFDSNLIKSSSFEMRGGKEHIWFRLPLADVYFFSLDKDKQLEKITEFVKTAYREAQQMRVKEK